MEMQDPTVKDLVSRDWKSCSLLVQGSQAPLEGKAEKEGTIKEAWHDSVRKLINVS